MGQGEDFALYINRLDTDGLVAQWNIANPSRAVRLGIAFSV